MDLYSLILQNKYILKLLYALAIGLICTFIVIRADKFYKLSMHKGIRYFRNAFLFFGVGFIVRYLFGILNDLQLDYAYLLQIIFEYFFIMAGFFLLYSLVWRKFESSKDDYSTSLFHARIAVFHVMALILAVMDYLWTTYDFMFITEIIIFFFITVLAYSNFRKDKGKHRFPGFYFFITFIGGVGWVLNFLAETYFNWSHEILIYVGLTDIIFFILFLYGVVRVTRPKNGYKET